MLVRPPLRRTCLPRRRGSVTMATATARTTASTTAAATTTAAGSIPRTVGRQPVAQQAGGPGSTGQVGATHPGFGCADLHPPDTTGGDAAATTSTATTPPSTNAAWSATRSALTGPRYAPPSAWSPTSSSGSFRPTAVPQSRASLRQAIRGVRTASWPPSTTPRGARCSTAETPCAPAQALSGAPCRGGCMGGCMGGSNPSPDGPRVAAPHSRPPFNREAARYADVPTIRDTRDQLRDLAIA